MNELRIDSFGRRRVSPFDGSGSLVVVPDVTKEFSSEIVDGGKDASRDDLPLDFGEPDFDLVKPGRVSGRKMKVDFGMLGQKLLDEFGFMGREIISDNVDLASEGLGGHDLGKKVDELGAGMALSGLAKDFSASGIESSVKGKSSVAVILKAMSFGPAWRKGQNRIQAVQGLDSTLFVHTKDGGMIRRGKIEADNVGGLLLKVGILAQHVTAQPVRLKAVASPNPRNGHVIGAELGGQPTAAPVGRSVLRTTTGPFQNSRFELCCIRPHFATLMTGYESRQTPYHKTLSPALNIGGTALEHASYRTHSKARAQCENDSGTPGILRPNPSGSNAPAQFSAFRRTNHNFFALHSLTMTHRVSHINVTSH
jgi:hypothetical protein